MTTVSFTMEGDRITGFTCDGHSGYAESGSDIVCAGISAAVGLTECAVNEVLGLAASLKMDQARGKLSLRLPGGLSPENEHTCQVLLTAMMVYLSELQEEYPDHLIVLEV